MPHAPTPGKHRLPTAEEMEAIGLVPLISPYMRNALTEMPDRLRTVFDVHGLTPRHGAVLPQLIAEQPLTVGELAHRMGLSLSTVSELVSALNKAGLVERREDPENRRRMLVRIDGRYQALVESFIARRSAPLLRALDSLTPGERAGFIAGLAAWAREARPPASGR